VILGEIFGENNIFSKDFPQDLRSTPYLLHFRSIGSDPRLYLTLTRSLTRWESLFEGAEMSTIGFWSRNGKIWVTVQVEEAPSCDDWDWNDFDQS